MLSIFYWVDKPDFPRVKVEFTHGGKMKAILYAVLLSALPNLHTGGDAIASDIQTIAPTQTVTVNGSTISIWLPEGQALPVIYPSGPAIGHRGGDALLSRIGAIVNTYGENWQREGATEQAISLARAAFLADPGKRAYGVLIERWVTTAPFSVFSATEYDVSPITGDSPDEIVYNAARPGAQLRAQRSGTFAGFEIVTFDRNLDQYQVSRSHLERVYRDAQNPNYQIEMSRRNEEESNYSRQRAIEDKAKQDSEAAAKATADAKAKAEAEKRAQDAATNLRKLEEDRKKRKEEEDRRDAEANRMRMLRDKAQRGAISPSELKDYTTMVERAERIRNTARVRQCDVDSPGPCNDNIVCPVCSSIDSYRSAEFAGNFRLLRNDAESTKQLDIFGYGTAEPIGRIKLGPQVDLTKLPAERFLEFSPFSRRH